MIIQTVGTARESLKADGFSGFVRFAALPTADVPNVAGVYVVLRPRPDLPTFCETSAARWLLGRDPSIPLRKLKEAWVPGAAVVYIGKADSGANGGRGLAQRLKEYRRQGTGEGNNHRGGRYVWHLADSDQLLVAWKPTPDQAPSDVEFDLIGEFVGHYGSRPFANRNRGRHRRDVS